jgi:hypothetical protein
MSHVYHYVGIILSHSRVSVTRGAKTNVILGLVHGSRRIPLSFMHGFSGNWGQCVPTVFFLVLLAALLVLCRAGTSKWAAKAANQPTTGQGANKHFYVKYDTTWLISDLLPRSRTPDMSVARESGLWGAHGFLATIKTGQSFFVDVDFIQKLRWHAAPKSKSSRPSI